MNFKQLIESKIPSKKNIEALELAINPESILNISSMDDFDEIVSSINTIEEAEKNLKNLKNITSDYLNLIAVYNDSKIIASLMNIIAAEPELKHLIEDSSTLKHVNRLLSFIDSNIKPTEPFEITKERIEHLKLLEPLSHSVNMMFKKLDPSYQCEVDERIKEIIDNNKMVYGSDASIAKLASDTFYEASKNIPQPSNDLEIAITLSEQAGYRFTSYIEPKIAHEDGEILSLKTVKVSKPYENFQENIQITSDRGSIELATDSMGKLSIDKNEFGQLTQMEISKLLSTFVGLNIVLKTKAEEYAYPSTSMDDIINHTKDQVIERLSKISGISIEGVNDRTLENSLESL